MKVFLICIDIFITATKDVNILYRISEEAASKVAFATERNASQNIFLLHHQNTPRKWVWKASISPK